MTGNPSPEADSATLLRRLSLDLAGLPPTPEELSAPFDFNRESERLLASPRFGKRWAREWLDAARYSDSAGYEKDLPRMHHFYRDWVVAAMNAGHALRRVHHQTDRRRSPPRGDAGRPHRHGLPPQLDDERGEWREARTVPH